MELGENPRLNYSCRRVIIESIAGGTDVFLTEGTVIQKTQSIPQPPPMLPIERKIIGNQVNFEGWKFEEMDLTF